MPVSFERYGFGRSSQWKKIKKSGHFKRSVKKKYLRILQSCSSLDQPACSSSNCIDEANLEETGLPPEPERTPILEMIETQYN